MDTNNSILSVVALGAICEIEDLSLPPRVPSYPGGRRNAQAPPDLMPSFARSPQSSSYHAVMSKRWQLAERKKMIESRTLHFYLQEFAELSNGQRVILRDDRGWSASPEQFLNSPWKTLTGRELTRDARSSLLRSRCDSDYVPIKSFTQEICAPVCGASQSRGRKLQHLGP